MPVALRLTGRPDSEALLYRCCKTLSTKPLERVTGRPRSHKAKLDEFWRVLWRCGSATLNQRASQRAKGVGYRTLRHLRVDGNFVTVIGTRIEMQLGWHACGQQALGIVEILVTEDVKSRGADISRG
jgi:hypothetical protein